MKAAVAAAAHLPPVRTILASLVWLAARHRERPGPDTLRALVCQAQRLLVHPEAAPHDLACGLRVAGSAYGEALLWLADLDGRGVTRH